MAAPTVRTGLRRDGLVVLRVAPLRISTRVHARSVWVTILLAIATAGVFTWSLAVGDFPIPAAEVDARADDPRGFMAWLRDHTLALKD